MEEPIRRAKREEAESLTNLWLTASQEAHRFLPAEYWSQFIKDMRDLRIPYLSTYVYELNGSPVAFLSLGDDKIDALFVARDVQRRGIGSSLITFAKTLQSRLWLEVFERNVGAVAFYQRVGFSKYGERIEPIVNERMLKMRWLHNDALTSR